MDGILQLQVIRVPLLQEGLWSKRNRVKMSDVGFTLFAAQPHRAQLVFRQHSMQREHTFALVMFFPMAEAFQAKYVPDGSIWYSCGPCSSMPAISNETPKGRTPPDSADKAMRSDHRISKQDVAR